MRKINQAGLRLIKSFEGLELKPYLCSANVPTIGYGTTVYPNGTKVSLKDKEITVEQAEEFLLDDLKKREKEVSRMVKVLLNDNEFSALVSFAYNVGLQALEGSTLLRLLNSGASREDVADQLLRWNKAKGVVVSGLVRRRESERSLFLQPELKEYLPSGPSKEDIEVKLEDIEKDIL